MATFLGFVVAACSNAHPKLKGGQPAQDQSGKPAAIDDEALNALKRGDAATAERLLEPRIEKAEQSPRDSADFVPRIKRAARELETLGVAYINNQDYANAQRVLHRSLALNEQYVGPSSPEVATVLNYLAEAHLGQQDVPAAESLYRRALLIEEPRLQRDTPVMIIYSLRKDHPPTIPGWPAEPVHALTGLERLYAQQQRDAELVQLYSQTLTSREQRFGPDHPFVAVVLEHFALFQMREGNFDQAETLYRRYLTTKEKRLGADDPQVAESYRTYASILHELNRDKDATEFEKRAGPAPAEMPQRFYSAPRPLE